MWRSRAGKFLSWINGCRGEKVVYYTMKYERSRKNREWAIKIHNFKCIECGINCKEKYGDWGQDIYRFIILDLSAHW